MRWEPGRLVGQFRRSEWPPGPDPTTASTGAPGSVIAGATVEQVGTEEGRSIKRQERPATRNPQPATRNPQRRIVPPHHRIDQHLEES